MKAMSRKRRIGRVAAALVLLLATVAAGYIALNYDPAPLSPQEVTELVDRINEGTAVQVPHFSLDDGKTRSEHVELFQSVERGHLLSADESRQYRLVYQELLRQKQKRLRRFDRNLTVLPNVGMGLLNNVAGRGISGSHDHHDQSSRSNYADLRRSLDALPTRRGPVSSARSAILAYKDLRDIILHLATAPHTKSVPYQPVQVAPGDTLGALFESVLREYKLAQFEPVNSAGYRVHVTNALTSYDALVLRVQRIVYANLTPFERTLAGTWAGWQSLSPDVDDYDPIRISRSPPRRAVATDTMER